MGEAGRGVPGVTRGLVGLPVLPAAWTGLWARGRCAGQGAGGVCSAQQELGERRVQGRLPEAGEAALERWAR